MRRSDLVVGFPPIARVDATILVLGTLPGSDSITRAEYYASTSNAFWKIMSGLQLTSLTATYTKRVGKLLSCRIALWDVLAAGARSGSTDASIVCDTEVPNNFSAFFKIHRKIELICFNGQPAEKYYKRLVRSRLENEYRRIRQKTLPSTSSANTHYTYEDKLEHWKVVERQCRHF